MDNYWDKKILEWEDSIRDTSGISFIENLASYVRKPILEWRSKICMDILNPFVKDKKILELGCGSGYFAFELLKSGPKHITGIDSSNQAIIRANKKKNTDRIVFLKGDVASSPLPEADITIGMGLLDYLSLEEIKVLFNNIKSNRFFFTFTEKRFSFLRGVHILYMRSQGCTKHFYYTKKEITGCIGEKYGKIQFFNDKKLSFACIVHNLGGN